MKPLTTIPLFRLFVAILGSLLVILPLSPGPAGAQVAPQQTLAAQYLNALNGGAVLFATSPDAAFHSPEGEFSGNDALASFRDTLSASFSDLAFTTDSVAQASDLTIISFTMTGTSTGPYHGLSANCGGVMVRGVLALRMDIGEPSASWTDGAMSLDPAMGQEPGLMVVTEQWIGYDTAALASQVADPNIWGAYAAYDCGTEQAQGQAASQCPATPGCIGQEVRR